MPPVVTREYRIPTDIDRTGNTNVGPQLQALFSLANVPDGTRVIFPTNGRLRTDQGLLLPPRKNVVLEFEGCALTTPTDTIAGRTFTDCVVSNPTNPSATTGTAVYTAAGTFPNFANQLWWALGTGVPGDTRVGYDDAHHVHLTKPVPVGTRTITFVSAADRSRTLLTLADSDHVAVNNYRAVGPNEAGGREGPYIPQLEAQHGIVIVGCTDVQIVNPDIGYVFGDCIATSRSATTGRLCSFIEIRNGNLHHNGRIGFTPKGITDWLMADTVMREIRRTAVDIEPTSAKDTCRRGKISGGSFKTYRFSWISGTAYNNVDANVGDIAVNGLEVGPIGFNIVPGTNVRWGPFTFTNITATAPSGNPSGYAMGFTRCDKPLVAGCKFMLQAGRNMRGVKTTGCTSPAVFWNDWRDGIGEWTNIP